jgi:hypothetical protein
MPTLSPVLSPADLTWPELQAARLDGDVYPLGDGYCLIGEIESPAHRAVAVLGSRSRRLIAELTTAAWVWGAGPPTPRPTLAVHPGARTRVPSDRRSSIREVLHAEGDIVTLGDVRVTSPLRTVLDLARVPSFDDATARTVARLAADHGLALDDCLRSLAGRAGLPGKHRAAARLRSLWGAQAVETR